MTPAEFRFLASFLKRRSGLALAVEKMASSETRLLPVARRYGLRTIGELMAALEAGEEPVSAQVMQIMTTNDTLFFRDKRPFNQFHDSMLPALFDARQKSRTIRIWCAASAAGQEPYSLAMILDSLYPPRPDWQFEIWATDLSAEMIARGRAGLYSSAEVQNGLPTHLLAKYFERKNAYWEINARLRAMVRFSQFNLMHNYDALPRFDIVFCRNVLFYFDRAARQEVLLRLSETLADDGYLILGAAETMMGFEHIFEGLHDAPGVYTKPGVQGRLAALA